MPCLLQRRLNSSSYYKPSCPSHSHLISSWRLSENCFQHRSRPEPPTPNRPYRVRSAYVLRSAVTRRHWSRGDAQRDAPALGSRRRESGLEAGRDSSPHLPPHLHRSATPKCLHHGAPISVYTVSRELGHGSEDMVPRVYSHLGMFRHRSEVVRVPGWSQHFERLGKQLIRMGFDTKLGTNPQLHEPKTKTPPSPLKVRRGNSFRSGPGATRTRDLLLRRGDEPPRGADQQ